MSTILKKIFGTSQSRLIHKYRKVAHTVQKIEESWDSLTDERIQDKTRELRERYAQGESLESLLPEAYAAVKVACRRLCGTEIHVSGYSQKWDMVPYEVQVIGAIAMHYGAIAEMQTGEGKTLTATMPLYLNALSGKPVHLVTVNDYLAKRDCEWIGTIFRFLGLRVEALTGDTPHHTRKEVYLADIVYGTASEFGFDYLRDNSMARAAEEQCQRGHFFAIVDEVDSILIDEARTPLIISGPTSGSRQMYDELKAGVAELVRLQRDLCNKIASDGKKIVDLYYPKNANAPKLSKEQEEQRQDAFKKLWLVSKGMPRHKIVKRAKEEPDLRAELEKWDLYFHAESNKEEKATMLADLFIIVDERASEYELTDKGIQKWKSLDTHNEDFVLLDLGHEYAQIDADASLSEKQKLEAKTALREEDSRKKERSHNLRQLFRAHLLMEKDVDYIIEEEKIVIIDEHTGRPQPGRRFSDGLHQAIEAKECVKIQGETQTYATITLQNYFRLYTKLAGMTGTAMTEAQEFKEIYRLEVLAIPTHRPCARIDFDDEIYMTEREKYTAILKEIDQVHSQGRPILIGTESVEASEKLSRILRQNKLDHTVLNAKNHAQEAQIIADAGKQGAITVATNMAGRGTDIKLQAGIPDVGGLHVLGTTRHQSRRIDRQLRGRSARLGDPGSSKFYVSFEDSLLRLFTSSKGITSFLQRFRPPEGEAISAKILNKSIETAQKRVEQRNYTIRKHTLEYDDVMNKQRSEVYSFRNDVLHETNIQGLAEEVLESACLEITSSFFLPYHKEIKAHIPEYCTQLSTHFPLSWDPLLFTHATTIEQIETITAKQVLEAFRLKISTEVASIQQAQESWDLPTNALDMIQDIIRNVLLRNIDKHWQEHLLHIDYLKAEVQLRSAGHQKDPLLEFKHEAFALFSRFSKRVQEEMAHSLFRFRILPPPNTVRPPQPAPTQVNLSLL